MRIFTCLLWVALAAVAQAALDPDLPSPAPVVTGIFPHGARRGTTTVVKLSGQNLHDARSVEFAGKGVRAAIVSSLGSSLQMKVTVDAAAEVGLRDFRLVTAGGAYVGVFDLGAVPEILEVEDNDDWHKPQLISLPVLVNGIIKSEDWDHFQFHAAAGEILVFDVSATRHGSRLDADLALLDKQGNEIAWVDDTTIFGDPHLVHKFESAGDYVVRVGSLAGGPNADYRLTVGALPYVNRVLPAGLERGRTTTLQLSGDRMDLLDEVWLGDRVAKGEIVRREANRVDVEFRLPKDSKTGASRIHASHRGMEIALPTEIRVSDLPEVTVSKAPLELSSAVPVEPSTVINGVIDQPNSSHYFRFQAKAGDHFLFHAESMKLGYHLDPALTVLDSDGKQLAFADDPGIDDRTDEYQLDPDLSYEFDKSGTYYVAIRDSLYRGGESLLYRLTVQRREPDFLVELREPVKSLYPGQKDTLQVRIRRRAGWTAPVEVWAEGLPENVTVEHQIAQAKDSVVKDTCGVDRVVDGTIVKLPVQAAADASGHHAFRIVARGTMDGMVVQHEASIQYQHAASGYIYGSMQMQQPELTITAAPKALLTTADTVSVAAGGTQTVKVTVRRFAEMKDVPLTVRARQLPTGVSGDPITIPANAKTGTFTLKAAKDAVSGPAVLAVVGAAGESAPFLVEVK